MAGQGPHIHCSFRRHQRQAPKDAAGKKRKLQPAQDQDLAQLVSAGRARTQSSKIVAPVAAGPSRPTAAGGLQGSAAKKRPYDDVEASDESVEDIDDDDDGVSEDFTNALRAIDEVHFSSNAESSEDTDGGGDWEYSLRPKKRKEGLVSFAQARRKLTIKRDLNDDVISLSSD